MTTEEALLFGLLSLVLLWFVIFSAVVTAIREATKPRKSAEDRKAERAARPWYKR
jgi:flagellar biosynthesis/type III secretory pathway M-ring protein FliF/YscJ